jgi:diadenosine tetraphosphate (Ap4A) HIT family hydrolase
MHATLQKFGYPDTKVAEFGHWLVLLRPQQCTLGALVLVAKSEATAFSDLPPAAFVELSTITQAIESSLRRLFAYEKINYLMLMMVDPQCHFHVLPRYSGAKAFSGVIFADPGWPGLPDLKFATVLTEQARLSLLQELRTAFATC